jgi:catechol 2,3-dioxygenase-like lactoylglutathione lyase family enzyme
MPNDGPPHPAAQRGKIAPAKLSHIVLRTSPANVAPMAGWYRDVLEAEVMFGNSVIQFLTYDEEHHRIAVVGLPGIGERPPNTVGVHHIAFTYASLSDLIHTYERLAQAGIEPSICLHHGPTLSMYFLDPDRNQVELQIDVFETLDEANDYLESEPFQRNPIGVMFDPAELARRFHAGVPSDELKQPIEGPIPPLDAFPIH